MNGTAKRRVGCVLSDDKQRYEVFDLDDDGNDDDDEEDNDDGSDDENNMID